MSGLLIPSFMVSYVSESLRSLTKNELPWGICSGRSPKLSESLVLLSELLIRSFFSQKTSDSLRKPISEFPALFQIHRLPLNEFSYPWTVRGLVVCKKKYFFQKKYMWHMWIYCFWKVMDLFLHAVFKHVSSLRQSSSKWIHAALTGKASSLQYLTRVKSGGWCWCSVSVCLWHI